MSEMEKAHRESARTVGEESMVHVEVDFSPGLVIDLADNIGRRARRAEIGSLAMRRADALRASKEKGAAGPSFIAP